jgi:hypothetical protein
MLTCFLSNGISLHIVPRTFVSSLIATPGFCDRTASRFLLKNCRYALNGGLGAFSSRQSSFCFRFPLVTRLVLIVGELVVVVLVGFGGEWIPVPL